MYRALMADYEYDAIQTCAADGTCRSVCPVAIDTGGLMKEFRRRERTDREEALALMLARGYATVERAARGGLSGARAAEAVIGESRLARAGELIRERVSGDLVPTYPPNMPRPARARLPRSDRSGAAAVYLPACINRVFANPRGIEPDPSLPEALVEVSARAGLPLWIPNDVAGHCCATPWGSKGYRRGHDHMAARTASAMWRWSDGGRLPVVIDATSCAHGLNEDVAPCLGEAERARFEEIQVLDSIAWVHDELLGRLNTTRKVASAAIHPTCSADHMGLTGKLEAIAAELAREVIVPAGTSCCGMAGDRGLLHPELPASALRDEAADLAEHRIEEHLCSNRTCEIALQQVTGAPYASFVLLLERLTRPR